MNRLASATGLGFLALLISSSPAFANPVFDSVRVEIRAQSTTEFNVYARFQLSSPFNGSEPLIHTALVDADHRIDSVVTSADGRLIEATTRREPHAFRLVLMLPDSKATHYEVSYRVKSRGVLPRVPVLVPEFATTRPQGVHISFALPDGFVLAESFPRVEPTAGAWRAVLSNVPSFVFMRFHPGQELTFSDRVTSVQALTNVLVVSLLVAFTLYWLRSRNKRAP